MFGGKRKTKFETEHHAFSLFREYLNRVISVQWTVNTKKFCSGFGEKRSGIFEMMHLALLGSETTQTKQIQRKARFRDLWTHKNCVQRSVKNERPNLKQSYLGLMCSETASTERTVFRELWTDEIYVWSLRDKIKAKFEKSTLRSMLLETGQTHKHCVRRSGKNERANLKQSTLRLLHWETAWTEQSAFRELWTLD